MKTRVLVVDDSPLIRAVLREAFERTSDLVVAGEAADGKEALAKVRELRPDIVTMDVAMPNMDGLAATREIMRDVPTPILIVARDGGDARALAVAALGHGALGVFPKPGRGFDDEEARALADSIRRIVRESEPGRRQSASNPRPGKTRVLIVDDSSWTRQLLKSALSLAADIEVVGEAADGLGALRLAAELEPDVVTLDWLMPMMDGRETAQKLMAACRPGILVVTQEAEGAGRMLQALSGFPAVEVFAKSTGGLDQARAVEMAQAIRRLANSARASGHRGRAHHQVLAREGSGKVTVVGIVGSTGAPRVLRDLVSALPTDFPAPIVLVQHTERGFTETLVSWLGSVASIPVRLASAGQVLERGQIVVAPDDLHMEIHTGGIVHLQSGDFVDGFRPSGTVLLASLARNFGGHAMGMVLSGMGTDGAEGLAAIVAAGGYAVVEDPVTASVPGMPKRALARTSDAFVEPSSRLGTVMVELACSGRLRR